MTIRIEIADPIQQQADYFAVRKAVFVDEQNVPADLEMDGLDAQCTQFIARNPDDQAVGTARLRSLSSDSGKVERVAVLAAYRGQGIGHLLMDAIEAFGREQKLRTLKLSAQASALSFYAQRGYQSEGEPFMEANIPHQRMFLNLNTTASS